MALIKVSNGSLTFPVMMGNSHSLRARLTSKVGGVFVKSTGFSFGMPFNSYMVRALSELNFEINDGDRVGIIGHNGAGKTSLLRVLSRAYDLSSGSIITKGKIRALTDFTLGMDGNASGRDNIKFRLAFMGLYKEATDKTMQEIIDFSELGDFIDMPVHTYSTGMYLRLAFSISTHFFPDILLMDEVIGAGDKHFQAKASERVRLLIENSNILVLSSHSLASIKEFCNKVLILQNGELRYFGEVGKGISRYEEIY